MGWDGRLDGRGVGVLTDDNIGLVKDILGGVGGRLLLLLNE